MDIKKTAVSDIHRLIQKDYKSLYQQLQKTLGDNQPFAEIQIGSGYYVWSDARCEWHQMIAASSIKQDFVKEAMAHTREEVCRVLGNETTERLFTYPDESYIYYNDDEGQVRILLTGWGFKKPVFGHGTADKSDVNLRSGNAVNVSFSFDGERLPNYDFGLRLAHQVKRFSTDDLGVHHFDDLKAGEHFTLVDLNSNREFPLDIVAGQHDYDFDVTTYAPVTFSATCDGQPVAGEPIDVNYGGKQYKAITDAAGNASMQLPLRQGEQVNAAMRDQQADAMIELQGTHIDFAFQSPAPPEIPVVTPPEIPEVVPPEIPKEEPKEEPKIKVMVRTMHGQPLKCQNIRFSQQDRQDLVTQLDPSGNTFFNKSAFAPHVPLTTFINGGTRSYAPITFTLEPNENTYLLQELEDKSSAGTILLEILAVIGTLIFLCILWYVFANFFVGVVSPFIASLLALL
ncbi:MAG: hypothetical protein IJ527_08005 [Prevotella sp.]|nr:hypothetical protein [Prevotella sp.]